MMTYSKAKDPEEYKGYVRLQMRNLGINEDDISGIVTSTEGHNIIKHGYKGGIHPATCMEDMLEDAPDYILDQIN